MPGEGLKEWVLRIFRKDSATIEPSDAHDRLILAGGEQDLRSADELKTKPQNLAPSASSDTFQTAIEDYQSESLGAESSGADISGLEGEHTQKGELPKAEEFVSQVDAGAKPAFQVPFRPRFEFASIWQRKLFIDDAVTERRESAAANQPRSGPSYPATCGWYKKLLNGVLLAAEDVVYNHITQSWMVPEDKDYFEGALPKDRYIDERNTQDIIAIARIEAAGELFVPAPLVHPDSNRTITSLVGIPDSAQACPRLYDVKLEKSLQNVDNRARTAGRFWIWGYRRH